MPGTLGLPSDHEFSDSDLFETRMTIEKGARGEPIELNENEYKEWLSRTAFRCHMDGDALIKEVMDAIKNGTGKEQFDIALQKLSQARLHFQHAFIHTNSTHDPDITRTGWQPRRLKSK